MTKMTLHMHHCELGSTSCLTLSAQWPVISCVSRSKSIRCIIRCSSAHFCGFRRYVAI